ncbi:hypothetical protein KUCAC02_036963, partial [Chaenocephalus aceratus]
FASEPRSAFDASTALTLSMKNRPDGEGAAQSQQKPVRVREAVRSLCGTVGVSLRGGAWR